MEVADILRAQGSRFLDKYQSSFGYQKLKAFRAIQNCRTAALGGHLDACLECGYRQAISYNSCRNRNCPKCYGWANRPQKAMKIREAEHWREVVRSVWHWSYSVRRSVCPGAYERTDKCAPMASNKAKGST